MIDFLGRNGRGGGPFQFAGNVDLAAQILKKRDLHLRERERALRLQAVLNDYLRAVDKELQDCAVAARMVGMALPELEWRRVFATSLEEEIARVERTIPRAPEETGIERENAFWSLFQVLLFRMRVSEAAPPRPSRKRTLTQFVCEMLEAAGGQGVKSGVIRDAAAERFEKRHHPKTVGMILNRLLREGLARREGRLWFSPAKKPAAPGASEPEPLISVEGTGPADEQEVNALSPEERLLFEARLFLDMRR